MTAITNQQCVDERGRALPSDAFGDSVAFSCPRCAHPVLAVLRADQRGSGPDNPARCCKCRFECWLEIRADSIRVYARTIG